MHLNEFKISTLEAKEPLLRYKVAAMQKNKTIYMLGKNYFVGILNVIIDECKYSHISFADTRRRLARMCTYSTEGMQQWRSTKIFGVA